MRIFFKLKSLLDSLEMVKDIAFRRYPSFIYGPILNKKQIPVFCLHGVEPKKFESVLQFLTLNNYRTISITEFYNIIVGKIKAIDEKLLLLTFDDGTGSLWATVYPLLKKYNCRATVFLIPSRIRQRTHYLPNLDDVWSGNAKISEILTRDEGDEPLSTWDEIEEMQKSGLIDFESHSYDHSLIFTSNKIIDFVNPNLIKNYHCFEFPLIRYSDNEAVDMKKLGAPIYSTAPRLSSKRSCIISTELINDCERYVSENGGQVFFKRKDWRKTMRSFYNDTITKIGKDWYVYESLEERVNRIRYEIFKSKQMIEEYLKEKVVRHLAYPWGIGSKESIYISKEYEYRTNFWNNIDNSRTVTIGQNPYRVNRIGEDFIYLLPGIGRKSLLQIIKKKIKRQITKGSPYMSR